VPIFDRWANATWDLRQRLADRLDRSIESGLTRSVSALAAPAFAAALLGRPLLSRCRSPPCRCAG
jgi:hypothetical protein